MWRCPRCGARNTRDADHCGSCGMPNPFGDGGSTKTIDIPPESTRPPEPEPSPRLPWIAIALAVLGLLAIVVVAIAILAG
jgi:uncharacterized membrane protein YvbJ